MYANQGYQWEMSGQLAMAVTNYKGALEETPEHYPAMIGLGRTYLKQGETDQALELLGKIPAGLKEYQVAQALMATAQFQQHAAGHDENELRTKLEADPNDIASHYALANLMAVEQRFEAALDEFLEVIKRDRKYDDDGARKAMLALFTTIGDDHPVTAVYRNKLASALF